MFASSKNIICKKHRDIKKKTCSVDSYEYIPTYFFIACFMQQIKIFCEVYFIFWLQTFIKNK